MADIVKVNWSGGKDSTCAAMLHLERGDRVKMVCYIPMFTKTIPLLLKDHYEFILRTADFFRCLGAEVHITTGMTYYDFVHKRSTRGKFKGRMFGFPCFWTGKCGFKRDSKLKALSMFDIGYYDYEDVGIAYDETKRHGILTKRKRSILCEMKMTEADATLYDSKRGLLSPHYQTQKRDGCTLCPHANARERESCGFSSTPKRMILSLNCRNSFIRNAPTKLLLEITSGLLMRKGA